MNSKVILIFILFGTQLFYGQKLLTLYEVKGSYLDSIDRALIIPKYNLKEDIKGKIFYHSKLLFEPLDKFRYSIYQIFSDRFLIITALNAKTIASNLRYRLPKNDIIIVDLENGEIVFKDSINNKYIHDIYYDNDNFLKIELANEIEIIINK